MTYDEIAELTSITFDVTQDDIDKGESGKCSWCPIARSIGRTLGLEPGFVWVPAWSIVHPIRVHKHSGVEYLSEHVQFLHSPETLKFVAEFDDGKHVEPTTFTVKRVVK